MKRILLVIKFSLLPILVAIYPLMFHYGNNVGMVAPASFGRLLILMFGIAIVSYGIFCLFYRGRVDKAAIATIVFLLFFNTYGILYNQLHLWDVIPVEHYTLLPVFILLALYSSWFITKLVTRHTLEVWNISIIILGGLILFNVVKIISVEIRNIKTSNTTDTESVSVKNQVTPTNSPDIYLIILDEYAGFEAARQYWHYDEIDNFVDFLKSKGFFVAEESHVGYAGTLYAMSTRLNYRDYPIKAYKKVYFDALGNNQVMKYLKHLGYTTVVFSEIWSNLGYPIKSPITADYIFSSPEGKVQNPWTMSNDFEKLVTGSTMMQPFIKQQFTLNHPVAEAHENMIFYTMDKVSNLDEVPSPKFVYIHLLLPHMPFMFDAQGNTINPRYFQNWNYYLGTYIFATHVAKTLVDNIMETADPKHLPAIILQSDHGPRFLGENEPDNGVLGDFPEEYKTLILNTLFLPGCDTSNIPQNVDPMNTFPIVFNCYFDARIPLK